MKIVVLMPHCHFKLLISVFTLPVRTITFVSFTKPPTEPHIQTLLRMMAVMRNWLNFRAI